VRHQSRLSEKQPSPSRSASRNAASRRAVGACIERLDTRTLLSVSFKFNIIDPTNRFASIRAPLLATLNAAGAEWSTHLLGNATLEYDVGFTDKASATKVQPLATGAAKSAEVIRVDPDTALDVYQVGTAREMITGVDPNGAAADGGITIYAPSLKSWFFDPQTNDRTAPIPEGYYDAYSIILQQLTTSLGFASTRDQVGRLPKVGMYTYDQHIQEGTSFFFDPNTNRFRSVFGFLQFGLTKSDKIFKGLPDTGDDNTITVYGESVSLDTGNPNYLGTGRFIFDPLYDDPSLQFTFTNTFLSQDDLSTDLMGGQVEVGERLTISKLDLAILKDSETPVTLNIDSTPEGLFTVDGTGVSDVISLSLSNGVLLVRVNKSVQTFDAEANAKITSIIINGLNGNDVITIADNMPAVAINGGAGSDTIYGSAKGDSITGGGGNDLIFGRSGGDVLRGGDGKDTIYGQGGTDRIYGEAGNDAIDGGVQGDRLFGGGNSDTIVGGTEDDFLYGENGNDVLSGAGGKDRMDGGSGADAFYGGEGNDSADYSKAGAGVVASIDGSPDDGVPGEGDNIIDAENIIGSSFGDALVGSDLPNSLIGGAGNDTIDGAGGNDTLEGNNGNDILSGGGGIDSLLGADGNDRFSGGTGQDRLFGAGGDDLFVSNDSETDTVDGGDGNDSVTGDNADVLSNIESTDLPLMGASALVLKRRLVDLVD
jgi:Ca2+-binding RTX toxin-like protein